MRNKDKSNNTASMSLYYCCGLLNTTQLFFFNFQASEKVLAAVCRPIYLILLSWLLDGELEDSHAEFFIEVRSIHSVERLWHDKYHVR